MRTLALVGALLTLGVVGALLDLDALDGVLAGVVGAPLPQVAAAAGFGAERPLGVGDLVAVAVVAEQVGGVPKRPPATDAGGRLAKLGGPGGAFQLGGCAGHAGLPGKLPGGLPVGRQVLGVVLPPRLIDLLGAAGLPLPVRGTVGLLGAAGGVPDRELDAARHEPTSLLVERRLAGLVLALHAPESFAPGGPAANRTAVARIAPPTLEAVVAARETARCEWALDHADALLDGIVAYLALRRRVERLGRARLRERSFAELILRVRVQLAQVGRRALAGRLADVAVGRALVRAEVALYRLLAEGDGEVWRTAPTEPLCPGLVVAEDGTWPARDAWLVCAARDDLACRHGGAEPHNRPVSGRGHHRSARPGGGSHGV